MKKILEVISNIKYGEIEITTPEKKIYKFCGKTKHPKAKLEIKSHKWVPLISVRM